MIKKIFIIIITYNSKQVIGACLDSLSQQTHQNFQLLLIDNNSTDQTINVIKESLKRNKNLEKKADLLQNKTNFGFAKAVNSGIKKALRSKDNYALLLLNPDISFTNDLLKHGVAILEQYATAGAAVPKILYSDNKIWWAGTRIFSDRELLFSSKYGIAEHIDKGKPWNAKYQTKEIDALTGCALFLRATAIRDVGLFNEKYFMYVEDIDYSERLKAKGYTLHLFTNSTVFHEVKDRKMNLNVVLVSLKKYKVYLKSVGIYLLENRPSYIFLIWLIRLPVVLATNFLRRTL